MKTKFLILFIISVLLTFTSCAETVGKNNVTVFEDGKTEYSIVMADGASEDEVSLVNRLASLSGTEMPMLSDASSEGASSFLPSLFLTAGEKNTPTSMIAAKTIR